MSCFDGDCEGANCIPNIISPHFPPRGTGWTLRGWPPGTPTHFKAVYKGEVVWPGNEPNQAVNSLLQVFDANGVGYDKAAICQWANEQWCEADPSRCIVARSKDLGLAAKRKASLISDSMQWATPFWQIWNVALSDHGRPESDIPGIMDSFVFQARYLTRGNVGCTSCAHHFDQLLVKYPVASIVNWRQARVWLWRVHNESRSNGSPVDYYEIAKIYGWDELTPAEVAAIVEELRAD